MFAKLTNGELEFFQQPVEILGDITGYAKNLGYKEVIARLGEGGTFETVDNIIIETPAVKKSILAPLEFLNRFTQQELRLIFTAAKSNIDIEIWQVKFNKASLIDLTDIQTIQGIELLASLSLVTSARKDEILLIE